MKMAASASRVISVMKALPSLKIKPPTAGNRASPNGSESQCVGSSISWWVLDVEIFGKSKSSVDDRRDFLASDMVSENIELRRLLITIEGSAKV